MFSATFSVQDLNRISEDMKLHLAVLQQWLKHPHQVPNLRLPTEEELQHWEDIERKMHFPLKQRICRLAFHTECGQLEIELEEVSSSLSRLVEFTGPLDNVQSSLEELKASCCMFLSVCCLLRTESDVLAYMKTH